jgi:uncharacterized protein (DUF58 family)
MSASATDTSLLNPRFLGRLERLALLAKRVRPGMTKGERRSSRKGASNDFADYRDYVQGDDLRHLDWNLYGRLDEHYLKLFEEREDLTLHLLLDASKSMGFGKPEKLDYAKQLAAALGYVALSGQERVCVEAFSGSDFQRIKPCRGRGSMRRLFSFLESIQAEGGTQLDRAGRGYLARNRAKGVTMVFSDFFDEEGFEDILKRLNQSRSEVYAVHILAPEEMAPRLTGDLKLVDSETGAFAEISMSRSLMKRYNANRDGFIHEVRQFCRRRGVGYFGVTTDTPIEDVVLGWMRRGGVVR